MRFAIVPFLLLALIPAAQAQQPGTPGQFDHYVLSLSWSPAYCESHPDARPQCDPNAGRGFVLHGLWPQYAADGWPANCPGPHAVPPEVAATMQDIMPSKGLIRHEWRTHGTCSGLPPAAYFAQATRAFRSIRIPDLLRSPTQRLQISVAGLERLFAEANPGLRPAMMDVRCQRQTITEVRICLDRALAPQDCSPPPRSNCQGGRGVLPPLR